MDELIKELKGKGVDRAFEEIGIDITRILPSATPGKVFSGEINPYGEYQWLVRREVPRLGTVVNAVPPDERLEELPWEEWFRLEERVRHHVLYFREPAYYDDIFEAPGRDDIHPPRTLGKRWYVVDDPDMSLVLLRAQR